MLIYNLKQHNSSKSGKQKSTLKAIHISSAAAVLKKKNTKQGDFIIFVECWNQSEMCDTQRIHPSDSDQAAIVLHMTLPLPKT